MTVPTRLPDDVFNGFVDDRLPPRAAREAAAALEKDPAGTARANAWKRQGEALRAAFGPIGDEPLPLTVALKLRALGPERGLDDRSTLIAIAFAAGIAVGLALAWLGMAWVR